MELKIKKGKAQRIYRIATLPNDFPEIKLKGSPSTKGDYYSDFLFNMGKTSKNEGKSFIYKMNNKGDIVFYWGKVYKFAGTLLNFKKHKIGSEVFYSFFEPDNGRLLEQSINYGQIVILNEKYKIIKKIRIQKSPLIPNGYPAENHVFEMLGKNHYIISSSVDRKVKLKNNKTAFIKAAYFQEIADNGKVLFEWDSSYFPELLYESVECNDYTNPDVAADYTHINHVSITPDNNFIVSMRNTDSIVKIDRKTGKILWTLGGKGDDFSLTKEQKFSRQHDAQYLYDGTLILFDNGNQNKQTRILKFKLDEKNKKVTNFDSFQIRGKFSPACGSVQHLKDNIFLIGWGYKSDEIIACETDLKNGKIIAEIRGEKNLSSYKIKKFD